MARPPLSLRKKRTTRSFDARPVGGVRPSSSRELQTLEHARFVASHSKFVTAQVVGQASRLPAGRLAPDPTYAGETPDDAGETPAPLPEQLPKFARCCTRREDG